MMKLQKLKKQRVEAPALEATQQRTAEVVNERVIAMPSVRKYAREKV